MIKWSNVQMCNVKHEFDMLKLANELADITIGNNLEKKKLKKNLMNFERD